MKTDRNCQTINKKNPINKLRMNNSRGTEKLKEEKRSVNKKRKYN